MVGEVLQIDEMHARQHLISTADMQMPVSGTGSGRRLRGPAWVKLCIASGTHLYSAHSREQVCKVSHIDWEARTLYVRTHTKGGAYAASPGPRHANGVAQAASHLDRVTRTVRHRPPPGTASCERHHTNGYVNGITAGCRRRAASISRSTISRRLNPVCERSGSTRLTADFTALSDIFSCETRSTRDMATASMS